MLNFPFRLGEPTGAALRSFKVTNYKSFAPARRAGTGPDQMLPITLFDRLLFVAHPGGCMQKTPTASATSLCRQSGGSSPTGPAISGTQRHLATSQPAYRWRNSKLNAILDVLALIFRKIRRFSSQNEMNSEIRWREWLRVHKLFLRTAYLLRNRICRVLRTGRGIRVRYGSGWKEAE